MKAKLPEGQSEIGAIYLNSEMEIDTLAFWWS
jgi:hypothetical protein